MKRKPLIAAPAVLLAFSLGACGPTPIHFDPVTLDPSQEAFLTIAAAWPTDTPTESPTPTSMYSPTPVTPSPSPTVTPDPATMPIPADSHPEWTYHLGSPNDISHIAVDPEGRYVWAATEGGLVRWDAAAASYTLYNRGNGLPDNHVTDVDITPDGIVWVATVYGGLAAYDGSGWKWYTTAQGLQDDSITEINVSPSGELWLGYNSGGISKFDGKEWVHWHPNQTQVYYIDFSEPEKVTVFNRGPVLVFDGLSWSDADYQVGFKIVDAAVTEDGTYWLAASEGTGVNFDRAGLLEKKGDEFVLHSKCTHIKGNHAYAVEIDSAGDMWIGTDEGLVSAGQYGWGTFTTQDGLPSNTIRDIAAGPDGGLWVGTDRGLAKMGENPLHWTVLAAAEEQDVRLSGGIDTLAFDPDDVLWFSLYNGILRLNGTQADFFPQKQLKYGTNFHTLYSSPDGSMWFLSEVQILSYRGGTWNLLKAGTGFPLTKIEVSAMDAESRLWIGEKQTIAFLEGGKWKMIDISLGGQKLPERLTSMAATKDGTVWVGSMQGLYQYREGTWTYFGGATASAIYHLISTSDGRVWGVAGKHVVVYEGTEWLVYGEEHHITETVTDIAEGRNGKIYISSNFQLVIFDGRETKVVGGAEGFPHNSPRHLAFGPDNSVWIGTTDGLLVYRP